MPGESAYFYDKKTRMSTPERRAYQDVIESYAVELQDRVI